MNNLQKVDANISEILEQLLGKPANELNPGDYPKWAVEDYITAPQDIALFLVQAQGARNFKDELTSTNPEEQQLGLLHCLHAALQHNMKLDTMATKAMVYQLWLAQEQGWFYFLDSGFHSLSDLISSMIDNDETSVSKASDLAFIVNDLIPEAQALNAGTVDIFAMLTNITKARCAIPHLREILEIEDTGTKQTQFKTTVGDIANTDVSTRQFTEIIKKRRNKYTTYVENLDSQYFYLGLDNGFFTVRFENEEERRAIEYTLSRIAEAMPGDVAAHITEMNDWLTKKPLTTLANQTAV